MEEQLIEYWRSAGKEISILPEDEKEKMWDAIRKKYLRPGVHIGYSICDALNCSLASSMGGGRFLAMYRRFYEREYGDFVFQ